MAQASHHVLATRIQDGADTQGRQSSFALSAFVVLSNRTSLGRCPFAVVTPSHKSGPADDLNNSQPISLLCCALKVFERLLLKRLFPRVNGAEEQMCTLVETLRLRARKRVFCEVPDVRKAFDVAWRNAVLVKLAEAGVTGSTWLVVDDLWNGTSARVLVDGILGPLLFNILFDGMSTAVRASCPGVALGCHSAAPRVRGRPVAWAKNRPLHTGFRRSLFQAYVLPAMQHGAAFLHAASVHRLDKPLRQWGRRLLGWPAGAPGTAVLGELGWSPSLRTLRRLKQTCLAVFVQVTRVVLTVRRNPSVS